MAYWFQIVLNEKVHNCSHIYVGQPNCGSHYHLQDPQKRKEMTLKQKNNDQIK
jgi:hypothetical protein